MSLKGFSCLRLGVLLALLGILAPVGAQAQAQVVRVAAVPFSPYVEFVAERPEGLLVELLAALNQRQDEYRFEAVPTSVRRRFRDLHSGRIDMAVFENPAWGWTLVPHTAVDMGLRDFELFVAARRPGRGQEYFDSLQGKRMVLYAGFHYRFADYRTDVQFLERNFQAMLTHSLDANLLMILRGRGDLALASQSFLRATFIGQPELEQQLLVSRRVDQVYRHHALLGPSSPISAERFRALLEGLRKDGTLKAIFAPYGVEVDD